MTRVWFLETGESPLQGWYTQGYAFHDLFNGLRTRFWWFNTVPNINDESYLLLDRNIKKNRSQLFQGWVSFFAAEMHQQIHPKVRGWPFKSRSPETVSAPLLRHCSAGGWAAPLWCCDSWGRSNEARWKRGWRRTNMGICWGICYLT